MIRFIYVCLFCFPILLGLFTIALIRSTFRHAPKFVHDLASLWSKSILFFAGTKVKVEGIENIDPQKGYLILVNHQSAFDIPVVMAHLPIYFRFIAKESLFSIPIFGTGMKMIDYIPIDRGDKEKSRKSLSKAVRAIESGHSILIFPEGTRTKTGKMNPFKFGFLKVAMHSEEVALLPITIMGTYDIMVKGSLKIRKAKVRMFIHAPLPYRRAEFGENREKSAKLVETLQAIIRNPLEKSVTHS